MTDKIKVSILLRNRRTRKLLVDPARNSFEFMGGVYMLSSDLIDLDKKQNAEVFYYEENPTPINFEEKDNSGDYLNKLIRINFIEQVDNVAAYRPNPLGDLLKFLSNPQVMIGIMLGGAVLYSLITSGGIKLW